MFKPISEVESGTIVNWQSQNWTACGLDPNGGYVITGITRRTLRIISGDTVVGVLSGWAALNSGQRELVREAVAAYAHVMRNDDDSMAYDLDAIYTILKA